MTTSLDLWPLDTNLLVITCAFTLSAYSAQDASVCEIGTNMKIDITGFSDNFALHSSASMLDVVILAHSLVQQLWLLVYIPVPFTYFIKQQYTALCIAHSDVQQIFFGPHWNFINFCKYEEKKMFLHGAIIAGCQSNQWKL